MKRQIIMGLAIAAMGCFAVSKAYASKSVTVTLKNAGREIEYKATKVIDGKKVTIKNKEINAKNANEIALLVINGGTLVLDHCTIIKNGDGTTTKSSNSKSSGDGEGGPGGGMPPGGMGGPGGGPGGGFGGGGFGGGQRPSMSGNGKRPERPQGEGKQGEGAPDGAPAGGPGGGPGGDDNFNFFGTNSAVVALGEGSSIQMIGCKVNTYAEYANAVFAADNAHITITDGITIHTLKNSSRGLFATLAGVIEATGVVDITTEGAHCAAVATDRGGGTVTVGTPGTTDVSVLNTAGDGSPCIYSTGDITVYNATGTAAGSQTMVIEGKNSITVDGCKFAGKSPKHGGIMLYQSMSGDAEEGTSVLNIKNSTIRDNSGDAMILVTNTNTVVNAENNTFLDKTGAAIGEDYPFVVCRNCNNDGGARWGKEGSNGGQVELNIKGSAVTGTLLANEADSKITVNSSADVSRIKTASGNGEVKVNAN